MAEITQCHVKLPGIILGDDLVPRLSLTTVGGVLEPEARHSKTHHKDIKYS